MRNWQFNAIRYLSVPAAALLLADWLLLPSALEESKATRHAAWARYTTFKQSEIVDLSTAEHGEQRIPCSDAGQLCRYLKKGRPRELTVWLQQPTPVHGAWIVAASENGRMLTRAEDTRSSYRELKIVWSALVLIAFAIAFVSWRMGPFAKLAPEEEA